MDGLGVPTGLQVVTATGDHPQILPPGGSLQTSLEDRNDTGHVLEEVCPKGNHVQDVVKPCPKSKHGVDDILVDFLPRFSLVLEKAPKLRVKIHQLKMQVSKWGFS